MRMSGRAYSLSVLKFDQCRSESLTAVDLGASVAALLDRRLFADNTECIQCLRRAVLLLAVFKDLSPGFYHIIEHHFHNSNKTHYAHNIV